MIGNQAMSNAKGDATCVSSNYLNPTSMQKFTRQVEFENNHNPRNDTSSLDQTSTTPVAPALLPPAPNAHRQQLAQSLPSAPIPSEFQLALTANPIICRGNLPKNAVEELRNWLFDHFQYPYPSDNEKENLMQKTGT